MRPLDLVCLFRVSNQPFYARSGNQLVRISKDAWADARFLFLEAERYLRVPIFCTCHSQFHKHKLNQFTLFVTRCQLKKELLTLYAQTHGLQYLIWPASMGPTSSTQHLSSEFHPKPSGPSVENKTLPTPLEFDQVRLELPVGPRARQVIVQHCRVVKQ